MGLLSDNSTRSSDMPRKKAATSAGAAKKTTAKRRPKRNVSTKSSTRTTAGARSAASSVPDFSQLAKMPKMMTAEQAIDLYKSNAKLALDVISAAIDSTARLRKKQFEGEEEMRAFRHKHARAVG